ncbi:DUF1120 domain-containing protein [Leclercia sp. AS011]|uniref:DUF1120 domain-containing protein n=1 Tax=Leclercia sp. AS011 TaxID=3081257 RepID=UPI00301A5AE2
MTNFKKKLSTLAICIATFAAANANAVDVATLSVKGSFEPAACTPTFNNSGVVDYGTMNSTMISVIAPEANSLIQLGNKNITLTVKCDAATTLAVVAQDNRSSSKVALSETSFIDNYIGSNDLTYAGAAFGLGTVEGGGNIGSYALSVLPTGATADGNAADLIVKDTDVANSSWVSAKNGAPLFPDGSRIATLAKAGELTPVTFTEMVLPMGISAAVQTKSAMGNPSEVKLDGNATLSLVYL